MKLNILKGFFVGGVLLSLVTLPDISQAQTLVVKQTTISGGNTQFDINHSYFWAFQYAGASSFDPVLAKFVMKRGPSTTQDAKIRLWAADSNSNNTSLLGSLDMPASQFTQSYQEITFNLSLIANPLPLPTFFNMTFESNAADTQNQAYFIKGALADSSFTFLDANGNPVSGLNYLGAGSGSLGGTPTSGTSGGGGAVPEPGEWAAMGILGAGLTGLVLRKRKKIA